MPRITDLAEDTVVSPGDLLLTVEISTNTSKKITAATLAASSVFSGTYASLANPIFTGVVTAPQFNGVVAYLVKPSVDTATPYSRKIQQAFAATNDKRWTLAPNNLISDVYDTTKEFGFNWDTGRWFSDTPLSVIYPVVSTDAATKLYVDEAVGSGGVSYGSPTAETTFGTSSANGVAITIARSDHTHGNPVHNTAAHSAVSLSGLAAPTASISWGNFRITNLLDPSAATDAANKQYVDNLIAGLAWKDAVRASTTANITLSAPQTVDGVAVIAGDRVLVKNQTAPAENGIYVVAAGAWTRATASDTAAELLNAAAFVSEGTTLADTAWVMTTNAPITVGTTGIVWAQFAGGGAVTAGAGMTQSGNTLNVIGDATITVGADSLGQAAMTGDVTRPVASNVATIAVNVVSNTKLADMATGTLKGRVTAATGDPEDLTATQATSILNTFTSSLKGLVPSSGGGIVNFLRADGTWQPASSGFSFAQDAVPTALAARQTWFNTATGNSYIWMDDGTSLQWIQFAAPGSGGGGGAGGFTYIQDVTPAPLIAGSTWFDTSTGASGGTSWVAIDNGSGSLIWVQFAPGIGTPAFIPAVARAQFVPSTVITGSFATIPLTASNQIIQPTSGQVSIVAGSGALVALVAGTYRASYQYTWNAASSVAGTYFHGYVEHIDSVGLADAQEALASAGSAAFGSMSGNCVFQMAANDYVRTTVSASTSAGSIVRSGQFMLEKIA